MCSTPFAPLPSRRVFSWVLACAIAMVGAILPRRADAQKHSKRREVPEDIMRAGSVAVDCDACPRSLAEASPAARAELLVWNRFRLAQNRKDADLIFLLSANPYLGDYLTRDGPDTRPVNIDGVILTVVDARTGQELWSDSRRWGSWRITGATRDLIAELRREMETRVNRLTLEDVLHCGSAPPFAALAFLTQDVALQSSIARVQRIPGAPGRLRAASPDVPAFCAQVNLLSGPDGRIVAFEVAISPADSLDVSEVLEHADQFDFAGGKQPQASGAYFTARTRDKKVLIEYDMQGRRPVLARVTFFY